MAEAESKGEVMDPFEHVLSVAFEDRAGDLVAYLRWYRRQSPVIRSSMAPIVAEYRFELKALLAIRRKAKTAWRTAERDRRIASWIERHGGYEGVSDSIELGLI